MKNRWSRCFRWLSLLLVMLLVTACGKSAGSTSSGTGLVVVDEGSSSKAAADSLSISKDASNEDSQELTSSGNEAESQESLSNATVEEESQGPESTTENPAQSGRKVSVVEEGTYTSKEEVAAYLHEFGHLPSNYITKTKAKKLGWDSSRKNLWRVAPGMSIGGGYFANAEGLLPEGDYRECDIDFNGKNANAKRLVYSDDGRIYYTDDHYKSFERLY